MDGDIFSKKGFNVGFFINYYLLNNLAFNTNLTLSQKGFNIKKSFELTAGFDYQITEKTKINLNYIDFPLLLKYHIGKDFEISSGLLLSCLISDKVATESTEIYETSDSLYGNPITIIEYTLIEESYNKKFDLREPNKILTGFMFSISYVMNRINLALNIHSNSSFGYIYNLGNNKNISLQFQAGYILGKRQD